MRANDDDVGAGFGERGRDGGADAAAGAGDQPPPCRRAGSRASVAEQLGDQSSPKPLAGREKTSRTIGSKDSIGRVS